MFGDRTIAPAPICQRGTKLGADCPCAAVPEIGPLACEDALATVAHELRGPLATILYALEVMADRDEVDPAVREAREVAGRQALRAVRIVDDLFDVCAGSLGKLSLNKEVVEVAGVVAGALEAAGHLLAGDELTVSLPLGPLFVLADPLRVEQVLTNRLANAAQFTDRVHPITRRPEPASDSAGQTTAGDALSCCRGCRPVWQGREDQSAVGSGLRLALRRGSPAGSKSRPVRDRGAEFTVRLPACSPD